MLKRSARPAPMLAARWETRFDYPHSFQGSNSALTNIPQKNVYPDINRNAKPGDLPEFAQQNVRVFPDWYKPYGFNYSGEGWFVFILGGFAIGTYTYF